MKKYLCIAVLLGGLFASCATVKHSYTPTKKFAAKQLHSDIDLLQKILQDNHPGLYWYTPKDSINYYFDVARASVTDSLTESQFRNILSATISHIRCGHTVVRHSVEYSKFSANKKVPQFPLSLKIWADSAVVVSNIFKKDSVLTRGTVVTSINGKKNKEYIDSMFNLLSTDGYSDNFKYQMVSFNFPAYYKNTFGLDSQYTIGYIDTSGIAKTTVVKNYFPKADSTLKAQQKREDSISRKAYRNFRLWSKRNMVIDTSLSTAILSVNTFSDGKLRRFYRKSFRQIKQLGIENVVLDLRQNSGGNVMLSTRLTQYLVDKPFKIADTVAAFQRRISYRKYIKPWFLYWLSMHLTGRKQDDNRIHFRYFERHTFTPKKKNHFDGNIYLVTGGYTFSAATLITGNLKGQDNVKIIGEETGGGAYGNSAMHLPQITLPYSKLRVTLPLYRLVINKDLPKNGRGIFPDIEVGPSSSYIRRGIDPKLEKVHNMIVEQRKNSSLASKKENKQ